MEGGRGGGGRTPRGKKFRGSSRGRGQGKRISDTYQIFVNIGQLSICINTHTNIQQCNGLGFWNMEFCFMYTTTATFKMLMHSST